MTEAAQDGEKLVHVDNYSYCEPIPPGAAIDADSMLLDMASTYDVRRDRAEMTTVEWNKPGEVP